MSSICHNTRSRARQALSEQQILPTTPAAMLPRANSESALSSVATTPGEVTPRVTSPAHSVDFPMRLYRDVVLTCIPSMPGALEATPIAALGPKVLQTYGIAPMEPKTVETTLENVSVSKEMDKGKRISFDIQYDHRSDDSSSERSFGSGDDRAEMWTTVQKKRTRTDGSRDNSEERRQTSDLNQEQENLVKLAEAQLSKTDRKKIEARERVLSRRNPRADSAESQREGPSRDKGKAPDPRN